MKTRLLTLLALLGLFLPQIVQGGIDYYAINGNRKMVPDELIPGKPGVLPNQIRQNEEKAIFNQTSFSLEPHESLLIEQPDQKSATLIRVNGSSPTIVEGTVKVNGTLVLINPNGIVLGKTARITGGNICLSTLEMRDEDFRSGNYAFSGDHGMAVINNGELTAGEDGSAGGTIMLMAGQVVNNGVIRAHGGIVQMIARARSRAAGAAIDHTGVTEAGTLPDGRRGEIRIIAEGNLVNVSGRLDVSAPVYGNGGKIVVSGEYVKIDEHAILNADGYHGGGEIYAGGGWMGCDDEIGKATGAYVAPTAIMRANALKRGNGGTIVAYSDVSSPNNVTRAYGTFEVYGGAEGGNGGNIETSGGWLDVTGSRGGASAAMGNPGTWLIDPYDIEISTFSLTTNGYWSGGTFIPNGDNAIIRASDINAILNNGTNVTISTSGGGTGKGSITVSGDITKTTGADVTLTLNADYRITINAAISSTSNKLHFVADAGRTAIGDGRGRIGQFNLSSYGSITTNGGNITASGVNNSVAGGTWNTYTCLGATCRGIQLDGPLNAGGGNISLTGLRRVGGVTRGVNITSTVQTSGSGTITINGEGNGDAYGVVIEGSAYISAANGNISITGDSENPSEKSGIIALAATNLETTGSGNVSFISTAGSLTLTNLKTLSGGTTYLKATGYNINLGNTNNELDGTVTVHSADGVAITTKTAMTLGSISATGRLYILTRTGNLTVTGAVSTSSTVIPAIRLIAEENKLAGDGTGGNIIISGGSVSTTGTAQIFLYTGSVSGSTGVTGLSNYSSSRVYYNSDENSTLSPTPGNGLYVVYRGPATPADPTSIKATVNPICNGSSTQLTANGAVGTVYWYTGSCGGTQIGTGNSINVSPTTSTTYYARNYNNSQYSSGCASLLVTVEQPAVSGTLTKVPDQSVVCQGSNVSATLTAGSGGSGTDSTYSRTKAGSDWSSWTSYTSGTNISTTGKTDVEIRTKRKGTYCPDATWTTVSWTVRPQFTTGAINTTGETICYNEDPTEIGNLTLASGGDNVISYQWQLQPADGDFPDPWSNISDATSSTYDPPSGLTATTKYRRLAKDGTCNTTLTASTGTWTVTVRPQFNTGEITATGETICYNGDPSTIGNSTLASGGDNVISYQWQSSTTSGSTGFADIGSATGTSYNPPSGLTATTWYRRLTKDGTCNPTFTASTGVWEVTVRPQFTTGAINTTSETICYNGNPALIGSTTDATGGDNAIQYQWQSVASVGDSPSWTDIPGATDATYDPPTGLTSSKDYRRMAKEGTCNTTFTASTGVRTVTVRPQFTTGAIETAGETICYNSDPAEISSINPASGGDNAISYQWQSSTTSSSTGFTEISGATTLNFNPETLNQTTWYRRMAKDGTCNTTYTASTGEWKVTVDPTTEAGAVTGGTAVCYGTNSTLLTLEGQTGDVVKWQYSNDQTNWTDIGSVTSTTYTAENLTEDTWFRTLVQSGVCPDAYSEATQITILTGFSISGYAKYENNPKTPLNGLKITLKKDGNIYGTPVVTSSTGYYEFSDLEHGNYSLEIASAHPSGLWQTWSGVNNTDYLLVSKHIAGTQLLPVDPPVVRTSASVKLPHPAINALDATAIRQAAKFPLTGYNYFDTAKWVFSGVDASNTLNNIELVCSNITREIRGLCSGDVNGTYVPPAGYKTVEPGLALINRGNIPINDEIVFPIRVDRDMEIGAITLFLDFDPSVMVVTNVTLSTTVTNSPAPWFNVPEPTLNLKPETLNTLQIGWMSTDPISVNENETVLLIHARLTEAFHISHFTFCDSHFEVEDLNVKPEMRNVKCEIRFSLNDTQISEFADGDGNVIGGLKLSIPDARIDDGNVKTLHATSLPMAITVYPNPAQSTLNLKLETLNLKPETLNLELLNLQATKVWGGETQTIGSGWNEFQIDVSELAPGVYFLRANVGGEILMKKVVISR